MNAATHPIIAGRDAKLLVVRGRELRHLPRSAFPSLLRPHDLVVANDAATLPASLAGTHVRTGSPVEVRLAGRASLDPAAARFSAVVFGAGDYRMATEDRPSPPALLAGDTLRFPGPSRELVAHIVAVSDHPRLVELLFDDSIDRIWEGLARSGRPVQYSYVPEPLSIRDTWTRVASRPVAFEPPSAGFVLDWSMLQAIRRCGARFATVTHAAGLSSTGDPELDRRLPFDEPYEIPASTSASIARSRRNGGRIIAVGTTVVRALESASDPDGRVRPGPGIARGRLGPDSRLAVADAIVSGMHEPGTSHYELLKAFVDDSVLRRLTEEAEAAGYRAHEFGDFMFVERGERRRSGSEETETEVSGETETEVSGETASQTGERGERRRTGLVVSVG
jgi:S-adenosylmethionine:tRNA ribosyltransferase-isomerase